ncbi:MAG TPA: hypothetical protein VJQ82_08735 [Terriglobales bacterium]|nr:hypothetical protein [Terriglobales bacterium]
MTGTRDMPRDLQDAPDYTAGPNQTPNMASVMSQQSVVALDDSRAVQLARECYQASTNWLNSGKRQKWSDSLRQFQGLHPAGSKYLSTDYRYRSRLFRPKTRAMVRKAEAMTAAAFFANEDVVSISAQDDDDQQQLASAEIMQRLLQYRLTKTIPWFLTLVGARQDAEVMGVCLGKAFWRYSESFSHTETKSFIDETGAEQSEDNDVFVRNEDHPWVDLIAPENFRFDPGADWRNPIATSPYLIELVPMYVADVRSKMDKGDWISHPDSALLSSNDLDDDTTRRQREQGRVPGKDHDAWKPRPFDICWVRENIIRQDGQDIHYFTLASAGQLLTKPQPIKNVYLQGVRPYVCGFIVPEAHKTYPTSKAELVRDLQVAANDTENLRFDNVKLALNPRQVIAQGRGVEPQDARVFMPGKVLLTKDPRNDIVWDRPPEVTQSAYAEQDRINLDFDELTGDISNSSIQANKTVYEAVGNMQMMQGNASTIGEYELRVFAETFVEPILRQLVKLEQAYETDPVVLAIAGREAQLFQKFGINQITDELLKQELTIRVNVGIGATNPQTRLKNFAMAGQLIGQLFGPTAAMQANFQEVVKEIFGLSGYKDGERFFQPNADPRVAMLQQQLQQAQKHQGGGLSPQEMQFKQGQLQLDQQKAQSENQFRYAEVMNDFQDNQRQSYYDHTKLNNEMEIRRGELALESRKIALEEFRAHHEMRMGVLQNQQAQQGNNLDRALTVLGRRPRKAAQYGA